MDNIYSLCITLSETLLVGLLAGLGARTWHCFFLLISCSWGHHISCLYCFCEDIAEFNLQSPNCKLCSDILATE